MSLVISFNVLYFAISACEIVVHVELFAYEI